MLRLYNFDFDIVLNISRFSSVKWSLCYNDIGTLEAHFPCNSEIVGAIVENIIPPQNKQLVIVDGNRSAIITGYRLQEDFAVYGRTCNWLLSKRITKKFDTMSGTCDALARGFVSEAFSDVDEFILGDELDITEDTEFSKDTNSLTSDVVKECLKLQNCGHSVDFDTSRKCWIYRGLRGADLSLVLSDAGKNAYNIAFTYDILDVADCGYYEKIVEGDSETTSQTTYLTTDGTKIGIYRWEAVLTGNSEAEALSDLKSKKLKDETSLNTRNIKFEVDYNLGDVVRVQFLRGNTRKTVKKRIIGVEILKSMGYTDEQPIFEEV